MKSSQDIVLVNDSTGGTNGVNTTYGNILPILDKSGIPIHYVTLDYQGLFQRTQLPFYKDVDIASNPWEIIGVLDSINPDALHIATPEGPLGVTALLYALTNGINFTTSYHTQLDRYIYRFVRDTYGMKLPEPLLAGFNRLMYQNSRRILVPTQRIADKLNQQGLNRTVLWPRGVNGDVYRPHSENVYNRYPWYDGRPIVLSFSRVAPEKNIDQMLEVPFPGHKVIIGSGPAEYVAQLQERYKSIPDIHFLGLMKGAELAHHVAGASVHCFLSETETFGNVVLESGASRVPTVAYSYSPGPGETIVHGITGLLIGSRRELRHALVQALKLDGDDCRESTLRRFSWNTTASIFLNSLVRA